MSSLRMKPKATPGPEVGRSSVIIKHLLDAGHCTVLEIYLEDLHAVWSLRRYSVTAT